MNATNHFAAKVDAIVERDPRFDREAYVFVRDALEFTTRSINRQPKDIDTTKHVSGQQLLDGARRYALEQYGPMVPTVLDHWGVRTCEDIGAIVFNLIEAREFGKAETDSLEDFSGGYDFHDAFVKPFLPAPPAQPENSTPPAAPERGRTRVQPASEHS